MQEQRAASNGMTMSTRRIKLSNGERTAILLGSDGIPLYYPTLYITSQVRGSGKSINTIVGALTAIKHLANWEQYFQTNLINRFKQSKWLTQNEIESLRDFFSKPLSELRANSSNVVPLHGNTVVAVEKATQYNRMTTAAKYLEFLAITVTSKSSTKDTARDINAMINKIMKSRPRNIQRSVVAREDKALPAEVVDKVFEVTQPNHPENPFKSGEAIQARNMLILALLRFTGIRRGELLNLQVEDIDFQALHLKIVRRPDAKEDPRINQPLVKTNERTIPIDEVLAHRLHDYVLNYRSKLKQARYHPYLFVTHSSRNSIGEPLTSGALGTMFKVLKNALGASIGPHGFRHYWNYEFSQAIDRSGSPLTPDEENQIRSYLMGWSPTSGTAATYNTRHIKKKASDTASAVQRRISGEVFKDNDA